MAPLVLTTTASAIDAAIQKRIFWSGLTVLIKKWKQRNG